MYVVFVLVMKHCRDYKDINGKCDIVSYNGILVFIAKGNERKRKLFTFTFLRCLVLVYHVSVFRNSFSIWILKINIIIRVL